MDLLPLTSALPAAPRPRRRRLPLFAAAGIGLAVLLLVPNLVATAVAVALGIVLAICAMAAVTVLTLRQAVRRAVRDRPHLARLGHRFTHEYDGLHVVDVAEDAGVLQLRMEWHQQLTVELDADGMPDSTTVDGAGSVTWQLPAQDLSWEQRSLLLELPWHDVSYVEQGLVLPQGPTVINRQLSADNGVVISFDGARVT